MSSSWSATESRMLEPYLRADELLHRLRFRYRPGNEYEELDVYWFDRGTVPADFRPSFLFDVDPVRIAEKVDIPLEDLSTTVVVRDRARKRWRPYANWPLSGTPKEICLKVSSQEIALGWRTEFVLMITPARRLVPRPARAYRKDQIVAIRTFQTNLRRDGSRFNVSTMPPTWFEQNGHPRDTVWALDWDSRDPYAEPIAALTVVMNERYEEAIKQQGLIFATQLATEILLEASMVALEGAESFEEEPSTLLGSILSVLGIANSEQFNILMDKIRDDSGRLTTMSFLRSRIQDSMGFGRAILAAQRKAS